MNFKNKDAKVVEDDFTVDDIEITLPKHIKVSMENQREGYKKVMLDSRIPHLDINEQALKTIVKEMKKDL